MGLGWFRGGRPGCRTRNRKERERKKDCRDPQCSQWAMVRVARAMTPQL
jgi:hypothetical protein